MASDTCLNIVNKVLRMTGDHEVITTVVGSPANIAERVIDFMNIVLKDICKKIEFPELFTAFTSTANGVDTQYVADGFVTRPRSGLTCTVDNTLLEEVSHRRLHELRAQNTYTGLPVVYARIAGVNGELGIDIYPMPPSGSTITILAAKEPTLFTVSDTSTTEVQADDLLELGAIAHMDAFSGMERGYMQLYEAAKSHTWKDTYEHQAYRIQPVSYR